MSMTVGSSSGEGEAIAVINTTPLVDVMLVLLIIFLITIPVVLQEVAVKLPKATNQAVITKPENIVIAVDKDGQIFWNNAPVADSEVLLGKLVEKARLNPQPEIHIRGDGAALFQYVGRVLANVQRAGIQKIGFISEPDHLGGGR